MYTIAEHIHNYAIWTAARAVQRGFASTANIKSAINATELREFIGNNDNITSLQFDDFHRKTANKLIYSLERRGLKASYGQAAKIIAIYLKTSVVLPCLGKGTLSRIIHPPIDSILLKNLHKSHKHLSLNKTKWTKLSEKEYFKLVECLRQLDIDCFWELEKFWTPIQNQKFK